MERSKDGISTRKVMPTKGEPKEGSTRTKLAVGGSDREVQVKPAGCWYFGHRWPNLLEYIARSYLPMFPIKPLCYIVVLFRYPLLSLFFHLRSTCFPLPHLG